MPSGQGPLTQGGPASLNMTGDTSMQSSSILSASSLISHWALLQHLSEKKCSSSRAFIVIVMLVVQPLGSRYLASSAGIPIDSSLPYASQIEAMVSSNTLLASGSPSTVCGTTYVGSFMDTYLWLCWENDATLCLTSWCVRARETPSTENVNTACSITE